MALYLVQHGKAYPPEVDPECGLSEEGRAEVERIAIIAKGYQIKIGAIVHSGKKRAQQTAEIFADKLGPGISLTETSGMDPNDNVISFATQLEAGPNLMYVGHLPFMEKLTSFLITGSVEKPVFKFQNGGIVCLDMHADTGCWIIKWTLMPLIS
jgi:phosphohistidine phosphatase